MIDSVEKVAKSISPYAWNDSYWAGERRGSQYPRNQLHAQNNARRAARDAINSLIPDLVSASTDLFDVPSELDSEQLGFHKGWELCARKIASSLRSLLK